MKHTRRYLPIAFITIVLLLVSAAAAPDLLDTLRDKLEAYTEKFPRERVYLHLSQPAGVPGQAVWFSGYVVDPNTRKPSGRSSLLHMKLLDGRNRVAFRGTFPVEKGKTRGNLLLADSLAAGDYTLIAYSSWMKNYPIASYYSRDFPILHGSARDLFMGLIYSDSLYYPGQKLSAQVLVHGRQGELIGDIKLAGRLLVDGQSVETGSATTGAEEPTRLEFTLPGFSPSQTVALQVTASEDDIEVTEQWLVPTNRMPIRLRFFPEGGHLVSKRKNRVAFEAIGPGGRPAEIKAVLQRNGEPVDTVRTIHRGRGLLEMKVKPGDSYRMKVLEPKLPDPLFEIPDPLDSGYGLRVEAAGTDSLEVSAQAEGVEPGPVYLVMDMGGQVVWSQQARMDSLYSTHLNIRNLPIGIARVTLFDQNGMARAERLVFLNAHKKLQINIRADRREFRPREQVKLQIRTTNPDGRPVPVRLSLSVHDLKQAPDDAETRNILSSLLLSSELRGEIRNPDWYFEEDEPLRRRALDLLMLTNGWRRISWQQLLQADLKAEQAPAGREAISGTVVDKKGDPVGDATVTLLRLGENFLHRQVEANADGRFYFPGVSYPGGENGQIRLSASGGGGADNLQLRVDDEYLQDEFDRAIVQAQGEDNISYALDYFVERSPVDAAEYAVLNPDVRYTNIYRTLQLDEIVIVGRRYSEEALEWQKEQRATNIHKQSISGEELEKTGFELPPTIGSDNLNQDIAYRIYSLVNRVTNVYALRSDGRILLRAPSSMIAEPGALFVIDGSRYGHNAGALGFLDVSDIKEINVYKGATGGKYAFAAGGVIEIITKSGSDGSDKQNEPVDLPPNEAMVRSPYTPVLEFYEPIYSGKDKNKRENDYRSTVHWQPELVTGKEGEAVVTFYTSDANTTYEIQVNALTRDGLPGASSLQIENVGKQ